VLLSLESSGPQTSAALLRGEEVVAEVAAEAPRGPAEDLLPAVDRVLRRAGVSLADVTAFAVSIGPGSFTGLRAAVATAKGLAFGGEPVVAVPTLAALALPFATGADPVLAVTDAQRGEVYAAGFAPGAGAAGWEEVVEEALYRPQALVERLPPGCVLVGEGVRLCEPHLGAFGAAAPRALHADAAPRARDIGILGARLLSLGRAQSAEALVPRYLRLAEAEARRTGSGVEPRSRSDRPRVHPFRPLGARL
jgi:tRNA threonylcarbamoyladenosine biosynthesis protein TsaB